MPDRVDLARAYLTGADLTDVDLTGADLDALRETMRGEEVRVGVYTFNVREED